MSGARGILGVIEAVAGWFKAGLRTDCVGSYQVSLS